MDGVVNTVFIVEDTDEVRVGLSRLLTAGGYRVKSFKSAEAFLKEQNEAEPGCLLLDVLLPGLSGIELQRELAGSPCARPIVFLTGRADVKTSVVAMKGGAVDFLTKPVEKESLFAALDHALGRDAECRREHAVRSKIRARSEPYAPRTGCDGARLPWPAQQTNCRRAGYRGEDGEGAPVARDVQNGCAFCG